MTAAEVAQLQREHEAMAHTLTEVENLVPPQVWGEVRQTYLRAIMAARERGQ